MVFYIIWFELVTVNFLYYYENTRIGSQSVKELAYIQVN